MNTLILAIPLIEILSKIDRQMLKDVNVYKVIHCCIAYNRGKTINVKVLIIRELNFSTFMINLITVKIRRKKAVFVFK